MGASRDFLSFFPHSPRGQTPQPIFTQNGSIYVDSRKDVPFAVKSQLFIPLISRAPKRSKFRKFLDVEIFSLDLAFNIRSQRENTPYYSSEPNENDIVNRQSGGQEIKIRT